MRKNSRKRQIPGPFIVEIRGKGISIKEFERRPTHYIHRAVKGEKIFVSYQSEGELKFFTISTI